MQNHNNVVKKKQTKDSRDSNVEPELHVGLPMSYSYSYENHTPSKVDRGSNEWNIVKPPELQYPQNPQMKASSELSSMAPETTGIELAQYRKLCDIHFKHLKSQNQPDAPDPNPQEIEEQADQVDEVQNKIDSPRYKARPEPVPNACLFAH